jgi:hypothetical protein
MSKSPSPPHPGGTLVQGPDGQGFVVNSDTYYALDQDNPTGGSNEAGGTKKELGKITTFRIKLNTDINR